MKGWRASMTQPEPSAQQARTMTIVMMVTAGATIVIAVVLGALVTPVLYAIAALAIFDFWFARRYAEQARQADASHNPYARED